MKHSLAFFIIVLFNYTLNGQPPTLVCPTSATIEVAETCSVNYLFEVSTIPSDLPVGFSTVQLLGDPSGTPLNAGLHNYNFEIQDMNSNPVDMCSWTITIQESPIVGAEMNCIEEPIIIDVPDSGPFEQTFDASDFLNSTLCADISLLIVEAELNSGVILIGPTITLTESEANTIIDITVYDPNGINSCSTVLYLDAGIPFPIPTLSQWALFILGLFISIFGIVAIKSIEFNVAQELIKNT